MKLSLVDRSGVELRQIDVDDAVFGIEPNLPVVHQAHVAQLANRRQGTASTLNRSDHRSSTGKTRRQKGTGRARQGGASSPVRRGGAVAHGPHPRSYRQRLPRRMRRLAIRSMLSQRAAEGGLIVLDGESFEPKTQAVEQLLADLGVQRSALLVTSRSNARTQARHPQPARHGYLPRRHAERGIAADARPHRHDRGRPAPRRGPLGRRAQRRASRPRRPAPAARGGVLDAQGHSPLLGRATADHHGEIDGARRRGQYVFEVDPRANKMQIKEAVEIGFNVVVRRVNTMNVRGRRRRFGRHYGTEPSWKKAVVTLADGYEIKLFEGV